MKKLHWTPLETQNLQNTVWGQIARAPVRLNIEEFEAKFSQKPLEKKV